MMNTVVRQRYQSAVYLNNTAVTFMMHGQHAKAMETLTDALLLIKSLVQHYESPCTTSKIEGLATSAVLKTQQRLASLHQSQNRRTATTPMMSSSPLSVVCYDGSLSMSLLLHLTEMDLRGHHSGLAILMNDVSLHDDVYVGIQEIAPAILLSNFALSHLYASSTQTSTDGLMLDSALRMLDISQSVLGVKQRTMEVNEGNMFLALIIVNNTCCVHQQVQDDQDDQRMHTTTCTTRGAASAYLPANDDWLATNQELDMLRALSHEMTQLTHAFVPVAGAA